MMRLIGVMFVYLFGSLFVSLFASQTMAAEEFDEFEPIVEINSTDGDIGFHVLLDGEGWKLAKIFDSDGDRMIRVRATDDGEEQGITEFFFESAEPLCWLDPDRDEDDEIVTLEEFVDRFEAGTYRARGRTIDGELLKAEGELTHDLPAAPANVEVDVDIEGDDIEVELSWTGGDDLGNCEYPDGLIPDPADVEVHRWEIVVEPNEDQIPEDMAFSKVTIQLPGTLEDDDLEVELPEDFIEAYVEAGVTEFKWEIGAREESGNQTFTEGEFEIEL